MLFQFDKYSLKLGISQYEDFLDNQIYLSRLGKHVEDVTNYQLLELRKGLSKHSNEQKESIEKCITCVCGTLEDGFNSLNDELIGVKQGIDDLNWQLVDLNSNISHLCALVDEKLSQIIDQHIITNNVLDQIARISLLPDFAKENLYYNKMGGKFLGEAVKEGPDSDLFTQALGAFQNALKSNDFDYVSLGQLGFIYLKSKKHCNVTQAKYFFYKSAINANAIEDAGSDDAAAFALFNEGVCNYILGDLTAAVKCVKRAVSIKPHSRQYKFTLAKYLAANKQGNEAIVILKELLRLEPLFSAEVLTDQDLITDPTVQKMMNDEAKAAIEKVNKELEKIKSFLKGNPNSFYQKKINDIEVDFIPKTYLSARRAMKDLKIDY